ncbi:tautomerase family protein [Neisseria perflava]|uniref:tautomerase family protein n=1 Tax=Neisseria perflava TaxID=33053 RepID=UPI0020A003D4|nr:tautomerase family protein [Neisseria perflava]MCP1661335.1 4-oxalocrotonate tautomerase [Neisseria perflava]
MPHINIKCYPKHLTEQQLDEFQKELSALAVKHLKAGEGDVSIAHTEIPAEEWQGIWDTDIKPNMDKLWGCTR